VKLGDKQGLGYHKVRDALEAAITAKRIEIRTEGSSHSQRHYRVEKPE
jgi:hypothetical protein